MIYSNPREQFLKKITYNNRYFFFEIISKFYPLTELEIINHEHDLNWRLLSSNTNIKWSLFLLKKFEYKLKWDILSSNNSLNPDEELINEFFNKWNWDLLSQNTSLYIDENYILRHMDKWNCAKLLLNSGLKIDQSKLINNYDKSSKLNHIGYDKDYNNLKFTDSFINKFYPSNEPSFVYTYRRLNEKTISDLKSEFATVRLTNFNSKFYIDDELFERIVNLWEWSFISMHVLTETFEKNYNKYQTMWDWSSLSVNTNLEFDDAFIDKYSDKWDWGSLMRNNSFSLTPFIEQVHHAKIEWIELQDNESIIWTERFFEENASKWIWLVYFSRSWRNLGWTDEILVNGLSTNKNIYNSFFKGISRKYISELLNEYKSISYNISYPPSNPNPLIYLDCYEGNEHPAAVDDRNSWDNYESEHIDNNIIKDTLYDSPFYDDETDLDQQDSRFDF